MVLSARVDDLKGGARKDVALSLLAFLDSKFGPCKAQWKDFHHTGIRHIQTCEGIFCHQYDYMDQLRPLDVGKYKSGDPNSCVDEQTHSAFSSLLGGVAWTVLTRTKVAVYVQALHR